MNRRQFCIRAGNLLLIFPAMPLLSRCGSSSTPAVQGVTITSTTPDPQLHSHSIFIPLSAFSTPAQAFNGTTSTTNSHTHSVSVTVVQMQSVINGSTVQVTSGSEPGHTHSFNISKS